MKSTLQLTTLNGLLTIICIAFAPAALAVSPPPDGGYPNQNTAEGENALFNLTTGTDNTALGFNALYSDTDGSDNTAVGSGALFSNTGGLTGSDNTAIGFNALQANTGDHNTATGVQALLNNTSGGSNTANGSSALLSNTTGSNNTALGEGSLLRNTSGYENTATGLNALLNNTTGSYNTASGFATLTVIKTGSYNIALGYGAGQYRVTGSSNIDIGDGGVPRESNTIRIGTKQTHKATFIAGISGATVSEGVGVIVDSTGHLGTVTSSVRFKEEIKPMDKASEAILSLQPVTFRYRHEFDPNGIPQFGLVAEQVEKVNPALVARDDEGKPQTVRYEAINAMLLNEFLKEHRKVEKLETTVAQLKSATAQQKELQATVTQQQRALETLSADLKKQAAQVQEVTNQLRAAKFVPRVVVND